MDQLFINIESDQAQKEREVLSYIYRELFPWENVQLVFNNLTINNIKQKITEKIEEDYIHGNKIVIFHEHVNLIRGLVIFSMTYNNKCGYHLTIFLANKIINIAYNTLYTNNWEGYIAFCPGEELSYKSTDKSQFFGLHLLKTIAIFSSGEDLEQYTDNLDFFLCDKKCPANAFNIIYIGMVEAYRYQVFMQRFKNLTEIESILPHRYSFLVGEVIKDYVLYTPGHFNEELEYILYDKTMAKAKKLFFKYSHTLSTCQLQKICDILNSSKKCVKYFFSQENIFRCALSMSKEDILLCLYTIAFKHWKYIKIESSTAHCECIHS